MEQAKKEQITAAFNEWLKKHPNRTVKGLAREWDSNPGYLGAIKEKVYVTSNGTVIRDKFFYDIMTGIGLVTRNSLGFHWDYVGHFKHVQSVCRNSQRKQLRVLLEADTGLGKTYGLSYYSKLNERCIYVQIKRSTTEASLLSEICSRLGINKIPRGNHAKMLAIRQQIIDKPNYLIIIDEQEYARQHMFHTVKEIADFLEGRAGFIVSGYGLRDKVKRLANLKKNGFPQFKRRFFPNIFILPEISDSDKKEICEREGISQPEFKNAISAYCKDFDMLSRIIYDCKEYKMKYGKLSREYVESLLIDSDDLEEQKRFEDVEKNKELKIFQEWEEFKAWKKSIQSKGHKKAA